MKFLADPRRRSVALYAGLALMIVVVLSAMQAFNTSNVSFLNPETAGETLLSAGLIVLVFLLLLLLLVLLLRNILKVYAGQGEPQDYAKAAEWFRKAAEQGHAEAQFTLSLLYHDRQGVQKDDAQAAKWLLKSAEQGYASAQKNLAVLYAGGEGVPQSYPETYFWLSVVAAGKQGEDKIEIDRYIDIAKAQMTVAEQLNARERVDKWLAEHPPEAPSHNVK